MKILIAAIHWPVASGRYARDAFKRIGCDVRTVGYSTGNVIWGGAVDDRYIWQADGDLTAHWDDWTPDLVVIMDSAWAYHHPVYASTPHIVWGVDNHVRDYRQAGVARYFLAHNAVSVMDMSAEDVEWLPCGYDPTLHLHTPLKWEDRPYDVALIGVMYPKRQEIVQALGAAGLEVVAGTGAIYEQYRDIYWNARISLCISAAGDVAQRVFETAAMGCWVLTDPLPDLKAIIQDQEGRAGISVCSTPQEFVDTAKEVIDGNWPARGGSYEALGFMDDWVKPHTWDARARRIVAWWQDTYGEADDDAA